MGNRDQEAPRRPPTPPPPFVNLGESFNPNSRQGHWQFHDERSEAGSSQWEQYWREWSGHDQSVEPGESWGWPWGYVKKSDWSQSDEKYERPYISHLDFPKLDGRKEEYANYQYAVLNLKSQCAPKDYKYLPPKK